ncbi:MAG: hypothetical protein K9J13_05885 [Saprospiraceae bacterium]|nr:hypothetical protein [Saprospiraceae bacterium]
MKKVSLFIMVIILSGLLHSCVSHRNRCAAFSYKPKVEKQDSDIPVIQSVEVSAEN